MLHILFQEFVDRLKGIGIRCYVKVERATDIMPDRIGNIKLVCRSCVADHIVENAMYLGAVNMEDKVVDVIGPFSVERSHLVGVFQQFIQGLSVAYDLVAYINPSP